MIIKNANIGRSVKGKANASCMEKPVLGDNATEFQKITGLLGLKAVQFHLTLSKISHMMLYVCPVELVPVVMATVFGGSIVKGLVLGLGLDKILANH